MKKGVGAQALMMFAIGFTTVVLMLPILSDVINSVSGHMTTTEYTVASLVGVFLLIGIFKGLISGESGPRYAYE